MILCSIELRKVGDGELEGMCKEAVVATINPLNAELNPICHLLALLGAHHILHVSRIRVKALPWHLPDGN